MDLNNPLLTGCACYWQYNWYPHDLIYIIVSELRQITPGKLIVSGFTITKLIEFTILILN